MIAPSTNSIMNNSGKIMKRQTARKVSLNTINRQRDFSCRWFIFALLGIAWGASLAQAPDMNPDLETLDLDRTRKNLDQIKSRIEAIQARLRRQGSATETIAANLEDSERKAAQLILEGRRLESVRARVKTSLSGLQDSASRLRLQRQLLRQQLARQMRVAYALGREGRLKLALNGQEPGDLPRLLRYHDYFSRARRRQIDQLNSAQERLQQTLTTIQTQNQQLASLAERRNQQARELAREREIRALALAKSERVLSNQRQRLAALRKNEQRLTELLEDLRRAIDDIPLELEPPKSFRALRGKLPWPIKGRLVQRFGDRSPTGDRGAQGVVLRARAGLEVRAIAYGRVVFADWLRGFGQLIIIDHGAGYMSLYGYNQSLLREPGEWVSSGDSIATVGDSGGQAKSGLYFAIRHAGQPLNPARWSSDRVRFKSATL